MQGLFPLSFVFLSRGTINFKFKFLTTEIPIYNAKESV